MRKLGLFVCIIFITGMLAGFMSGCNKAKKGIIILPGVCGSALVDSDTGEVIWDPLGDDITVKELFLEDGGLNLSGETGQKIIGTGANIISTIDQEDNPLIRILVDENGESIDKKIMPATMDTDSPKKYGALGYYEQMCVRLSERYKDYEVSVFNYDWRIDNRISANRLEQYIEDKGYDKVIFVSHSMGGIIATDYLAKSEANRDKVELFISVATPYYGSIKALTMLLNPGGLLDILPDIAKDMLSSTVESTIAPILRSYYVIYQLLPQENLFDSPEYADKPLLSIDGEELTYNDLLDYIKGEDWIKTTKGEIRPQINGIIDYHSSHYVEVDGALKHVTELVNTYYLAGNGMNMELSVELSGGEFNITRNTLGDGTVSVYSATLGKSVDDERVFIYDDVNHGAIVIKFTEIIEKDCFELIDSIGVGEN